MVEYSKGKTDDEICRYKIMSNLSLIRKNLISLGITQSQADIYILLLQKGSLRISDITKLLNLPRSSVYENLKGLFNIGLAEEIIENS